MSQNQTFLEFQGVVVVARDLKAEDRKEITYISQGKEVKTTKVRLYVLAKHVGKEKRADLFRLVLWGKMADAAFKYLKKGRKLHVEGHLSQNVWKDKEGKTQSFIELVTSNVIYLDQPAQEKVVEPPKKQKKTVKKASKKAVEAPDASGQL